MVTITGVLPRSRAAKNGILPGDVLLEINGYPIRDVLDYRFRLTEEKVTLKLHRADQLLEITIKKGEYDDIGLEFQTPLMDKKHRCENGCIFCFIDQNPKGMREAIYFKDDDSRLSFLHGNYITLTNLHDEDIDRILEMHISPINVSVHTTNPELRVKMMKNKRAGEVLSYLKRLAEAGTKLRGQIVLCKGINDGAELERSLKDLCTYYPALDSVSVVPAGLTGHRENLYTLEAFTPEECRKVIEQVNAFGEACLARYGERIFYAADEFYVKSGVPLPDGEYYGEYSQIENGVGMLTSFEEEFHSMLRMLDEEEKAKSREISVATGEASYEMITTLVEEMQKECPGIICHVHCIKNNFFGGHVTVTGLLTGKDIAEQLKAPEINLGETLYLSRTTLRSEGDLFLCGMSPKQLEETLGVPVSFVDNDGAGFLCTLLGIE